MKKIYNALVSTYTMALLFVVFIVAMASATFIEAKYGTETARTLIYDAWWFELIMVLGLVNLIGNIFRFRLYRKEKWHSFIFHIAFIFILIGAAVTRYIGYEGQMRIIEGQTSDKLYTEKNYIFFRIDDGKEQLGPFYKRFKLTAIGKNRFDLHTNFKGKPVSLTLIKAIPHAKKIFVPDNLGKPVLTLVESTSGKRKTRYIPEGEGLYLGNFYLAFGKQNRADIRIFSDGQQLFVLTDTTGYFQVMRTGEQGSVPKDSIIPFHTGALYTFGDVRFVVPEKPRRGEIQVISGNATDNPWNYLQFKLTSGDQSKTIEVFGGQYYTGAPVITRLNGLNFVVFYGPKIIRLPFKIQLNDFQLKHYPGSNSPMSYSSQITVIDKDTTFPYNIHMNHVLDYRGYRFFQSSYNITPQYEETVLSVNHDFWGTSITYFGYFLLYFGLIMIFFNPNSLYHHIRRHLAYIQQKRKALGFILVFSLLWQVHGQEAHPDFTKIQHYNKIISPTVIPDTLAEKFGLLVIQDYGGRMKPVDTYASELLRKLSKHDTWKIPDTTRKINADQFLFSMILIPQVWAYVPVIYLERGDTKVREILGLKKDVKYASLGDFFDENGEYKLAPYVEKASKTRIKPKFLKDIENIDRRVNLLYSTLMGVNLRLFPKPGDPRHKWYSPVEVDKAGFQGNDSLFVVSIFPMLRQAVHEKDYKKLSEYIGLIDIYQKRFGKDVYPDPAKLKWEMFYNKYDAFRSMFWKLMLAALLMLFIAIAKIIRPSKLLNKMSTLMQAVLWLMFFYMVFFLGLRWYINGHAPWSNAYESMIYVILATFLFGLWFGRKSDLTAASAAFIASIMLMVAHWNWMDPAIENLVPVLNSYWLMIHVAAIVASYGPFILGAMLALLTMFFIIFTTKKNKPRFELIIKELTDINKMSLIVGLVLLTVGNFLGGQWANESWGRYWGWDPKETWALISIMTYALIIHSHIIPALRGLFKFNVMALFGVLVIMMTYFGVNFYLAGLHSYAKGEPVQTPASVYISVTVLIIITLIAAWRYWKIYKNPKENGM